MAGKKIIYLGLCLKQKSFSVSQDEMERVGGGKSYFKWPSSCSKVKVYRTEGSACPAISEEGGRRFLLEEGAG